MANPDPSPETRFAEGNPGGPGRPRGSISPTAILKRKLAEAGPDGRTVAEAVVDAWLVEARGGDHRHIKEIVDRIDGKVPDKLEQSGGLTIRVEYADADGHDPDAPSPPRPEEDPGGDEAV